MLYAPLSIINVWDGKDGLDALEPRGIVDVDVMKIKLGATRLAVT